MLKTPLLLATTALLVTIVAAACAPAAPTEAPAPVAPNVPAPQQPAAPAANQAPAAAAQTAPLCQNATTCEAPKAQTQKLDCVNKVPYTNVLVAPGTKFEVVDKSGAFTCNDSGNVVNGKTVLSCYGTQLQSFDLKLTNSSCGGTALQTGTGQCKQGYGYDAAQQCCAPVASGDTGSTTVRVDLGGCPLPRQP